MYDRRPCVTLWLTKKKTRLICAAGPRAVRDWRNADARWAAREHACTAACVHASDGACACATKYGRADRMTDGGTPGATESGDSRDTSSHSPTHFRLERSPLSLSLSLFSSSHIDRVPPRLLFLPLSFVPADVPRAFARTMDSHAWILFFLRLIFDVSNRFVYILNRLEINGTFYKSYTFCGWKREKKRVEQTAVQWCAEALLGNTSYEIRIASNCKVNTSLFNLKIVISSNVFLKI